MKSRLTTSTFRNQPFGTSLVTAIIVCLSGSAAFGATWDGTGTVVTDWNDNGNWVGDAGTGGSQANINITSPIATISANIVATPVDIVIGEGVGVSGRLDHIAGTAQTGGGNWMKVGKSGGTGVYNLADTTGTGGILTGYALGSGSMSTNGGRLYIGGEGGSGSNGTVNVNTTGTLTVSGQLEIATNTSTGVLNIDNGTVTTGGWTEIGNGGGCTGTLNMSGGSLIKNGGDHFIVGANGSTGFANIAGGSITVNNEIWVANNPGSRGTLTFSSGTITNNSWVAIGRAGATLGTVNMSGGSWNKTGGGSFIVGDNSPGVLNLSGGAVTANGEFWVGQGGSGNGTLTMSNGTLATNSWMVVGRAGGTGVITMTGGTWTHTGNTQFIVGSTGPGTMTMSNGLVNVLSGYTWVGERKEASTAVLTISNTADFRSSLISVGPEAPNAMLNLDGGTVRTRKFMGTRNENDGEEYGIGTINFNGSQIIATADNTTFIAATIDNAVIGLGGLLVNSNGFILGAPKSLSGTGGVVKSGVGKLSLLGVNSYAGNNTINGGELVLRAGSSGTGSVTLADGTAFGVSETNGGDQLVSSNVTFGTTSAGTALNLNMGDIGGTNSTIPILNVTGNLVLNGDVTVNVTGSKFDDTVMPLVAYLPGTRSGAGKFVLNGLPNGVVATLVDDPNYQGLGTGMVYLNITSVALPEWDGTNEVLLAKLGDTTELSAVVHVSDATGIVEGQTVRGAGIPTGTTVVSIAGLDLTLSQAATATSLGADLKFVTSAGTNEGLWDTTTQNWIDQVSTLSSVYGDPNPVLFSDLATGPTAVVLNSTVRPSDVVFNNSAKIYSLSGTGKISGVCGLTKSGTQSLTLVTTNDYTGVTTLAGGTTSVATLTNAGGASPLGAATAAPSNLVLAGGILEYTGASTAMDRGFTIAAAGSGIRNTADLTVSGQVLSTLGSGANFRKRGAGNLALTYGGTNTLGVGGQAVYVEGGTLTFDGTAGGQTNIVANEMWIASIPDVPAHLTITNTTLNMTSWLAISRGNGNDGVCNMNVTNSTLTTGNFSTGYNNGLANNASEAFVNVSGSTWTNSGAVHIAEGIASTTTVSVLNSPWTTNTGDFDMSAGENSTSTLTIGGTSEVKVNKFLIALGTNSVANVIIEGSGKLNKTGGDWMSIGNSNNGVGTATVRGNGSLINSAGDFNIADVGTSQGTLNIQDSGTVSAMGVVFVGKNTGTSGTVNMTGGTFNSNSYITIGRNTGATGFFNLSGGTVNQTDPGAGVVVGENGTGTFTISGTGTLDINGGGFYLSAEGRGTSISKAYLNGGTIIAKRVVQRDFNADNYTEFHFNGGILRAHTGASLDFMSGHDLVAVDPGGAFIDTNGQTIAIAQALDDGGGDLTKQGAGTLLLNGASNYLGTTTVAAGALGGTGSVAGPLVVPTGSSVAPGAAAVGMFTANDSATIGGSYVCEIGGANADKLVVAGALDITGAVLDINELSAPAATAFVIASYGTLSGTFTVQDLPAGYTVDYNYLGGNQIALVANAYTSWAMSYGLDPRTDGAPGFDKDGDGQINSVEFALGGSPISGSDNARIFSLAADSSADEDTTNELLLTIAVRSGTPVFAGSPSPTATLPDGLTYSIEGSTTLEGVTTAATPVTTVVPPAPNATPPAGYEYRTFSLDGSNGLPTKGFLRVKITN